MKHPSFLDRLIFDACLRADQMLSRYFARSDLRSKRRSVNPKAPLIGRERTTNPNTKGASNGSQTAGPPDLLD